MRSPQPAPQPAEQREGAGLLWRVMTFERLWTGPLVHLVYWCGLGLIALGGFSVVGAAVGVAIRGGGLEGAILAVPLAVVGLLIVVASALLWRGACEFYMAVLRIAEDFRAVRLAMAAERRQAAPPPSPPRDLGGGFKS